jgi:class 3 adenylate cyclase/tetratricopeptide (TPR) repeat protein
VRTCPNCGRENPDDARFCNSCAQELAPTAPSTETRKIVTIVFCDVTGSTSLGEQLDPESLRKVMTRYFEAMRAPLERHGGTIEKFIGDAVMAVFGVPIVREDDALRAVRAVAEMRDALADLNKELERDRGVTIQTRIGVHTGEVMAGDATSTHSLLSGDAANVAARLEQAAAPGDVLLSAATQHLVRDAVSVEAIDPLELKGKSDRVAAFRLLGVHAEAAGHVRRMDSAMVGRQRERILLRQAFDRSASERACHLFTVLGPAGVGKSRLSEEFLREVGAEASVFQGRCLSYGDGITFWPVAEIVSAAADLEATDEPATERAKVGALLGDDTDAERIAADVLQVIGSGSAGGASIEENLWAVRRLFESLASDRPLVLVFDDLHWAEPTLLDLLDHVADLSRDAPILLFCMARPELLDQRPSWGGGKFNATSVLLEPLNEQETDELVDNLLGHVGLDEAPRSRILRAAEGNPLYVEELISLLIEEELLVREERWVSAGQLSEIPVPPSVQAVLAARLDRLSEAERNILGRASVIGKVFYVGAVRTLSPDAERSGLSSTITSLIRKGLIRPERSDMAGEEAYRFHHLLLRDAAYQTLTKEARAELHERFATWLETAMGDRADEQAEIVGYHLEQALRYHLELGPESERTGALEASAAHRLLLAGKRARERFDMPAAITLLERGLGLLPEGDARRADALLDLGDALERHWHMERADETFRAAADAARLAGDTIREGYAELSRVLTSELTSPDPSSSDQERRVAETWIQRFAQLGDERGLALCYRVLAAPEWLHLHHAAAAEHYRQALVHARAADDRPIELDLMWVILMTDYFGPATPDEFGRDLTEMREIASQEPVARVPVLEFEAHVAELEDDLLNGERLLREAAAAGDAFGIGEEILTERLGWNLTLQERWRDAGEAFERGFDMMLGSGDAGHASTQAANAARAWARAGEDAAALRLADESERLGAPDDIASHTVLRQARALVAARDGRFEEAEELAKEAVALHAATDCLSWHVDGLVDLALVFEVAGKPNDAIDALQQALEISIRKGDRARQRIVTERIAALGAGPA